VAALPTPFGAWQFNNHSGIAFNNGTAASDLANDNGTPPTASRVGFITGEGAISVNIGTVAAGTWRCRFKAAARRINGTTVDAPGLRLTAAGEEIYEQNVTAPAYTLQVSRPFYLASSGSVTLRFDGLDAGQTVLLDDVRLEQVRDWHDGSSWSGGVVPTNTTDVEIPYGAVISMRSACVAKTVTVNGQLLVANVNTSLATRFVHVTHQSPIPSQPDPLLEIGTERSPLLQNFTLTLTGQPTDDEVICTCGGMALGKNGLVASMGAKMEIHGKSRQSWKRLNAHAPKGATSITLDADPNWTVGDEIVISSSDYDHLQAEKRIISQVSPDGKTLSFTQPLDYPHYGELQTFKNGAFQLDERAEVGLLTRNIIIQGQSGITEIINGKTARFGGHTMVTMDAVAHVTGVRFRLMGQEGRLGRYPWHWHELDDLGDGQYIRYSTVDESFNRAFTIHATNKTLVHNNVAYDHIGHGYFFENGDETGNTLSNNLGLVTRKPQAGLAVQPHDDLHEAGNQVLPSTYWIANPSNDFIGNVCAGSQGSGFWFLALRFPASGTAYPTMSPRHLPMGVFNDNRSHSTDFSNLAFDRSFLSPTDQNVENQIYQPRDTGTSAGNLVVPVVHRFTGYKCRDRNIWLRTDQFELRDCRLADSDRNTFFSYNGRLYDSLIVGNSANIGYPQSPWELADGRSLPYPNENTTNRRGHALYDGPSELHNVHFAGFDGRHAAIQHNNAALKSSVHQFTGVTWEAGMPQNNRVQMSNEITRDSFFSSGFIDVTGAITGTNGAQVSPLIYNPWPNRRVYDAAFNRFGAGITDNSSWGASIHPSRRFATMQMAAGWADGTEADAYVIRNNAPAVYLYGGYRGAGNAGAYQYSAGFTTPTTTEQSRVIYSRLPAYQELRWLFCNPGEATEVQMANVPSGIYVFKNDANPALSPVSDLNALRNSGTSAYYMKGNTCYMLLKATDAGSNVTTGSNYTGRATLQLCLNNSLVQNPGRLNRAFLADYEGGGVDTRGSTFNSGIGGTSAPVITHVGSTNVRDSVDDYDRFTMPNTDSDAFSSEYVEYRLNFEKQNWSLFSGVAVNFTIPSDPTIQAKVYLVNEGSASLLGTVDQGGDAVNLPHLVSLSSNVTGLRLRFMEASLSGSREVRISDISLLPMPYTEPFDRGNNGGWRSFATGGITSNSNSSYSYLSCVRGNDPKLEGQDGIAHRGTRRDKVHVRFRSSSTSNVSLAWKEGSENTYPGGQSLNANYAAIGTWQTLTFNVGAHAEWNGKDITMLRLDSPGSSGTTFDIETIIVSHGFDADQDGATDTLEGTTVDTDGDNTPDFLDSDSNGNIVADVEERNAGTFQNNSFRAWHFNVAGDKQGWIAAKEIDAFGLNVSGGFLKGLSTDTDPVLINTSGFAINSNACQRVVIRYRRLNSTETAITNSTGVNLFFNRAQDGDNFTSARSATPSQNLADPVPGYRVMVFDLAGNASWTDAITKLRFDPTSSSDITFDIDYIATSSSTADVDGDGTPDAAEGYTADTDGDGTPNWLDSTNGSDSPPLIAFSPPAEEPPLTVPLTLSIVCPQSGTFCLIVTATPGSEVNIESSPDLVHWSPAGTHTMQSSMDTVPISPTAQQHFFRAIQSSR
jgi:hypothetical protein